MADSLLQDIVCCFGQPVAGNPTQFMMERAFIAAGIDWRYLTLEVPPERLAMAVAGMKAMGFRGGNLTIPHKVAVLEYLDDLTDAARLIGAVNCISIQGDQMIGENTDGKGFVASLREQVDPQDKLVVILGAGGASRAIAVETALAGAKHITIVNRSVERAEGVVQTLNENTSTPATLVEWSQTYSLPEETDILINATSVGLGDAEAELNLNFASIRPTMLVADVIFNPPETHLLKVAQAAGSPTLDGLGMLVNQGAIAFEIWTGLAPDKQVMREALEEYLEI